MKFLDDQYFKEVEDHLYRIHPTEIIIFRL